MNARIEAAAKAMHDSEYSQSWDTTTPARRSSIRSAAVIALTAADEAEAPLVERLAQALRPLAEYPAMESMREREAWICRADAPNGRAKGIAVEDVFVARAALAAFDARRADQ